MTHIKQQDIANILKVSRVTVSKALRDHPDISEEMKKKVKQVANQLDYTPNFVARSLSSKRTNTIGVVIPDTTNSYFSHVINGIMDAALEKGYQIILTISRENHELEEKNIKSLMAMRVDGLLVCITQSTKNAKSLNFINKNNIPLVLFDRSLIGEKFNTVLCNDREAAFSAIDFAIKKGYRKIAHLAGQSPIMSEENGWKVINKRSFQMILKSGMSGSFRAVTRKKTAIKVLKNFMQKVIFRNWFFPATALSPVVCMKLLRNWV